MSFSAITKHCQLPSVFVYFVWSTCLHSYSEKKEATSSQLLFLLQRALFLWNHPRRNLLREQKHFALSNLVDVRLSKSSKKTFWNKTLLSFAARIWRGENVKLKLSHAHTLKRKKKAQREKHLDYVSLRWKQKKLKLELWSINLTTAHRASLSCRVLQARLPLSYKV